MYQKKAITHKMIKRIIISISTVPDESINSLVAFALPSIKQVKKIIDKNLFISSLALPLCYLPSMMSAKDNNYQ